jgi:thiamine-monophosphate kinase
VTDTVASLGERAVLGRIFPRLPVGGAQLLGPGDDAAVVAAVDGRFVVTTDMMIEGPDFRREWSTAHDLGWKAAASNLADVAAMGAVPTALVVGLAVPTDTPVEVLEQFADGLRDACAAMAPGCGVVGGDLSASPVFTISVTAFGDLEGRSPVLRSGARVGDTVAVAGAVGEAHTALRLLFRAGVDADGAPDAEAARGIRHLTLPQLAPHPPIAAGRVAALAGATSMLDVSDGLALDASRIGRASGVALDLDRDALGLDPDAALAGGEDHAMLATFPGPPPAPFRAIGTVVAGEGVFVDGTQFEPLGWDPYR